MNLLTEEELNDLMTRATAQHGLAQTAMGELVQIIQERNEDNTRFIGAIDGVTYGKYQKIALELYELAHQILIDAEQRGDEYEGIFSSAVVMVTISFQIMTSSEIGYRRHCIQKGVAISKLVDYLHIPRQTLTVWRQLVDDNPRDLAPRMDAYLKEDA